MGLMDEDEDLDALRLAALQTLKAKSVKSKTSPTAPATGGGGSGGGVPLHVSGSAPLRGRGGVPSHGGRGVPSRGSSGMPMRGGFKNRNNAIFQRHYNSNLIAIVPITPSNEAESPGQRPGYRTPRNKFFKNQENTKKEEKPAVKTKFNRYDSSSSDSSDESDDNASTASSERDTLIVNTGEDDNLDNLVDEYSVTNNIPSASIASDNDDTEPISDLSLLEEDKSDNKQIEDSEVESTVVVSAIERSQDTCSDVVKNLPISSACKENIVPVTRTSPVIHRSPHYSARSRSKTPVFVSSRPYAKRSPRSRTRSRSHTRSRSRSRSRPRLARSRSPRRYGPRHSISPKRRALSPRYLSPRRRSPLGSRVSPYRHLSPTDRFPARWRGSPSDRSPVRRRLSSPRRRMSPGRLSPLPPRRYGSPVERLPSPHRKSPLPDRSSPNRRVLPMHRVSPWRRVSPSPSPPRRHYSPPARLSPRRRAMPSDRMSPPRRRKSPSPVKRNPSPPRRFSPQRRSPVGRISPPRRNPSPPRKLYPISSQPPRSHSPRWYPSPSAREPSPRRYNSQTVRRVSPRANSGNYSQGVRDSSPWSPPRNGLRPVSPQFSRKRSISPRARNRRSPFSPAFAKSERKSISPRPLKRRDSLSPRFQDRKGSVSPKFVSRRKSVSPHYIRRDSLSPRPDYKRRKVPSPRPGYRRGSSPSLASHRRRSISPRPDRKAEPVSDSPRLTTNRRSSFSPKGPKMGTKKRSRSTSRPKSFERRLGSSPVNSKRLEERDDSRLAPRIRDTNVRREKSRSISLSPPPERVKEKSPLRVRSHRRERTSVKKRTKVKKSREKTGDKMQNVEKISTEKDGEGSSLLEARRKKFENADPVKPVNKKIRLRTIQEEVPDTPPIVNESEDVSNDTEQVPVVENVEGKEGEDLDDLEYALVIDSPADLWSDEESDSGNEGRFKSAGRENVDVTKVSVPSFTSLLKPSTKVESKQARERIALKDRRSPSRDRKRRREKKTKDRPLVQSVLDRIGDRSSWKARRMAGANESVETCAVLSRIGGSPNRLPALLSKEIMKPDMNLPINDTAKAVPDSTDQHGDLRAALSRKRAARSNILQSYKGSDLGAGPGTRLLQTAFLDVVGKKHKRAKKSSTQASLLTKHLGGAGRDGRRVTLYNKEKRLPVGVSSAADELTVANENTFSDENVARKPSVKLRLGMTKNADDYPNGRKVQLKRNSASSDQV